MTNMNVERSSISIDNHTYRTIGKVRTSLVSRPPGKVTIGDYSDQSNPMASEFSMGDFRDGIGVEIGDLPEDQRRAWWSTAQLRYKNRVVLPRLANITGTGLLNSTTLGSSIGAMEIFDGDLWMGQGFTACVYDNSLDQWNPLLNQAGVITDMKAGICGGVYVLAVADGTRLTAYTDTVPTYEISSIAAKYVAFWKDLLWVITDDGQLAYTDEATTTFFTMTNDAVLQLPSGSVTGLLVARGPDREDHLYAVTKEGLYVHDDRNARFLKTDLQLPIHPDGGKGNEVWRGSTYISAGNSIYSFQAGSDRTIVDTVGPDRDHGLPSDRRGVIRKLVGSHNELFALLDASTADGVTSLTTRASRGARFHHGVTFPSQTGFSTILGWNERGWEAKWVSGDSTAGITAGVVGTAYNEYRLWWAANKRVYWMKLPVDVVNPLQVTNTQYDSSATLETPWMDFGIRNQKKLALSTILETVNPTSGETVKVEYALDFDETYTEIATQDTTGEQEYHLPNRVNREGVIFRAIKFKFTFARGSTNTNTPQLIKFTLVWRPRVQPLYGFTALLDLSDSFDGAPPVQQIKNLRETLTKGTLVPMSFKDDDTGAQTYLVDIIDWQSAEESGEIDSGQVRLVMAEPIQSVVDDDN